jgi:hypothetical protein
LSSIFSPAYRPAQKKQEFDELSKEVENFSSRLEAKVKGLMGRSSVYKFVSSRNEY